MINDNLLNANGTVLEDSLTDTLNPSIIGGVTKEGDEIFYNTANYYGANGDGGSGSSSPVSPEMIQSSIAITKSLLQGLKNKRAGDVCKKPLLPESGLNHNKWNTYRDCLRAEEKKIEDAKELAKAKLEQQQRELELLNAQKSINDGGDSDKILGMPKGVAIGVGVLVLAVGGFFVYKKFIAKN